jgi:hypothetical protein
VTRRAQEDGLRNARPAGHHIRAEMKAVNLKDVEQAAVPVHRLNSLRPPAAEGMRGRVALPQIRLDLDDPRAMHPSARRPQEPGAEQVLRDGSGVAPEKAAALDPRRQARRIEEQGRERGFVIPGWQFRRSGGAPGRAPIPAEG